MAEAGGTSEMNNDSPLRKKSCRTETPEKFRRPVTFNSQNAIKVSNLPREIIFMERSFQRFMETVRKRHKIEPETLETINKVCFYSKEESSVLVEFSKFEIAEAVSKLQNVVWQKETLTFELAVYANDTLLDNTIDVSEIIRPPMFASTPASRTVVMSETTPTPPQGDTYDVEILMKGCSPFPKVRRKLNTVFNDNTQPSSVTCSPVADNAKKDVGNLTPVCFKNLEEPFKEEDFKLFLEKQIEKKCVIPDKDKADKSFIINQYKAEEKSVIVEFSSLKVAEAVCLELQFKEYMGEKLTVSLRNDMLNRKGSNIDKSEYVGPLGAVFHFDDPDDPHEPIVSLGSEQGKAFLNEALLKTRCFFLSKHNHSTGYVQIISYLKSKGVDATIPDVARMRRNLNNSYNSHKKKGNFAWPNYKLCSIIFDGAEISENETYKYGDALIPMDPAAVCKLFTKGAVFTAESRSYLIQIVAQNSDKRGSMFFWDSVSSLMEKQGYYYSAGDCKEEFGTLDKTYKDIEGMRRRTGAPATQIISNWKHFHEMKELAKNDVAHNPAFTFSAGSSSLTVTNLEPLTRRDSRVNSLKKPQSKAEKKSAISLSVLEELKRGNDLKEKYLQSRES